MVENFMTAKNSTLASIPEDEIDQETVAKIGESMVKKYEDSDDEKLHIICIQYEDIFYKEVESKFILL